MILDDRQKRARSTVCLAIQCVVAGNTVTADEQDREAPRSMTLVVTQSVQRDEPRERRHETVLETRGVRHFILSYVRGPPAGPQCILGNLFVMDDRIASKTLLRILNSFEKGLVQIPGGLDRDSYGI